MEQKPDSLATAEAATELGVSQTTVWRACKKLPGFSTRVLGEHRIPRSHIARVKHGEALQDIATSSGANTA